MYLYASLLLLSTYLALGQGQAATLDPFETVETCINGAVGIQPSTDSSYSYEVQGNPDFAKYYSATVKDGVLYVQNEAATSSGAVQSNVVIVNVPSDALKAIKTTGNGIVNVVSGFSVSDFDLTSTGNGAVNVQIDVGEKLTMDAAGNGAISVSGSSGTADITTTGNGIVSLYGLKGNADVAIAGNGVTYIGGSETTAITGTKTSFSPLTYQGASCDVTGGSTFSPGCEKVSKPAPKSVSLPTADGQTIGGLPAGSCGVPVSPAQDAPATTPAPTSTPTTPAPASTPTTPAPASTPTKPAQENIPASSNTNENVASASFAKTISGVLSALVLVLVVTM